MPKAPKGPFFFYMLEFRRREAKNGKKFPGGMKQIAQEAGPSWNLLSDAERQTYKEKADAHNKQPAQRNVVKYTTQGIPFSQVEEEKQRLLEGQKTTENAIKNMLQGAVLNNALEKLQMYFISVNHFCKTSTNVFVPAELAMVQYNLESGVQAKLHELINPIKLPLGSMLDAKQLSEETHDLPIPPNAMGETDLETLLAKILHFTDYNQKVTKCVPLIADEKEIPVVESILEQCYREAKIDYNFLVVPLGELFFLLKQATEQYGFDICEFPSIAMAKILLQKDPYEYTAGIGCEFHEKKGNTRFCALSKVVRWTYILSDNCCLDLTIDLVPGCHLPLNADTTLSFNTTTYTHQGKLDGLSMSSAAGTSENLTKIATAPANPFHKIDVKDSVYDPNLPRKSTEKITVSTENIGTYEVRGAKDGIIRQPGVSVAGRGRGALIGDNSVNTVQPSTSRQHKHETK